MAKVYLLIEDRADGGGPEDFDKIDWGIDWGEAGMPESAEKATPAQYLAQELINVMRAMHDPTYRAGLAAERATGVIQTRKPGLILPS